MAFKQLMPWRGRRHELGWPFEELRDLPESMHRFMEEPWSRTYLGEASPRVNIEDTGKEIVVSALLPGMDKEDVEVEITQDSLTLRGSQTRTEEQRRHGGRRRAQAYRSFYQSFTLPAPVKKDQATAAFKKDTLEIRVPRLKETETRRVDIQ